MNYGSLTMDEKKNSVLYFLPCSLFLCRDSESDTYRKKKNLLSVDCCSEFVTVFALWKSFALLHIISKDLWIMQWTESVLFQNYLTLHQNDIWAKCSLSTAVRVQMKFFTYKPKTLCGWKKYYIFYEAEIHCVMMKIE